MVETLLEKQSCAACGAEVRKGAVFCFNCGEAVEPEVNVAGSGETISSGWFRENIAEEAVTEAAENPKVTTKLNKGSAILSEKPIENPIEKPVGLPLEIPDKKPSEKILETKIEETVEKNQEFEQKKLKSAADLRRKTRTFKKKEVEEVVWEEYENAPNVWFLLVALTLVIIAAGLFYMAIFMK